MGAVPHLFSLSKEEYRKVIDEAEARCEAERKIISAQHKAQEAAELAALSDPRAFHYLTWKGQGQVCILVVKHYDAANSIAVSRDGSAQPHVYLPNSRTQILEPESQGEFLLALIPRSFVSWLERKDFVAGQRFRDLFGITLPLTAEREWTEKQVATWMRLDKLQDRINYRIQTARMPQIKRRELTLTRNGAA